MQDSIPELLPDSQYTFIPLPLSIYPTINPSITTVSLSPFIYPSHFVSLSQPEFLPLFLSRQSTVLVYLNLATLLEIPIINFIKL